MKKIIWIFTILILATAVACSGSDNDPTTPENTTENNNSDSTIINSNTMILKIGNTTLTATLAENSSTIALKEALAEGPITIDMSDYANMEKVGSLGRSFPSNNQQITTEAGDLILYQGNMFVIYYAPNSWNFTRLGKIDNTSKEELMNILGAGDVKVTLSLVE